MPSPCPQGPGPAKRTPYFPILVAGHAHARELDHPSPGRSPKFPRKPNPAIFPPPPQNKCTEYTELSPVNPSHAMRSIEIPSKRGADTHTHTSDRRRPRQRNIDMPPSLGGVAGCCQVSEGLSRTEDSGPRRGRLPRAWRGKRAHHLANPSLRRMGRGQGDRDDIRAPRSMVNSIRVFPELSPVWESASLGMLLLCVWGRTRSGSASDDP